MVSVEEARRNLQQQRQLLDLQKQNVTKANLPNLSRAQRQVQTRQNLIQRKIASQELSSQKRAALLELSNQEALLQKEKARIDEAEARRQALISQQQNFEDQLKIAKKFADKPEFFQFLSPELRQLAKSEAEIRRARLDYAQAIKEANEVKISEGVVSPVGLLPKTSAVLTKQGDIFSGVLQSSKKETYVNPLGYVSTAPGVPEVSRSTVVARSPTQQEQFNIELAKEKGRISELPPVKFLAGEYDWQKELESSFKKKNVQAEENIGIIGSASDFLESQRGKEKLEDIPFSPQGFTPTTTDLFFKGTDVITKGLEKTGVDTSKKVNIPKKTAQDVALFSSLFLFDPFLRTGTAGKVKGKQVKKGEIDPSKVREIELDLEFSFDKAYSRGGSNEVVTNLRKIIDKSKTPEAKESVSRLLEQLRSKGYIKSYVYDSDTGQLLVNFLDKSLPQAPQQSIVFNIQGLPEMRGSSAITSSLGGLSRDIPVQPEQVRSSFLVLDKDIPKTQQENPFLTNIFNAPSIFTSSKSTQKAKTGLLSGLSVLSSQTTKQAQPLRSVSSQTQSPLSVLAQPQASILSTRQRTKQTTRQIQRQALRKIARQRTKQTGKLILPGLKSGEKTISKLKYLREKGIGVDVLVGMKEGKQRIIAKGLWPFEALRRGSRFVDENIEASFRLVPSKQRPKGRRPTNITPLGVKFRPSKRNPLFLVEKRKYRLDSPLEKRQIKSKRKRR